MFETAGVALATLFAVIGPLDVAAVFAGLTATQSRSYRRSMALKGTLIATGVLLVFALIGDVLLTTLGISLAALRTAGGILLLITGISLVTAKGAATHSASQEETEEAVTKDDISVFPLATPLIAGPGAMAAIILLMANTEGDLLLQGSVIVSLLIILLLTYLCLIMASELQKILGVTGMHIVARLMGVLLTALAVQFIFDGILQSGLINAG